MKLVADDVIETDVLVIGAGGAGTSAALMAEMQGVDVVTVCKGVLNSWSDGCTSSGPSVFTACGYTDVERQPGKVPDTWKVLFDDMLRSGRFMNNQQIVERHAKQSAIMAFDLEKLGVIMDRTDDGRSYLQTKYGGHSRARTGTIMSGTRRLSRMGYTVLRALVDEFHRRGMKIIEEFFITKLLTAPNGAVNGAVGIHIPTGDFYAFKAKSTVIASGGYNKIYGVNSSCPIGKTGDGGYMAYEVGAELVDLEFYQFHPGGGAEYYRSLGGRLYNSLGERFMRTYSPKWLEVATRDFVSQCEFKEVKEGRQNPNNEVWLSFTHMDPEIQTEGRLKTARNNFLISREFDTLNHPSDAYPHAHYANGGIRTDVHEATNVPGLYAAGEVTGGTHGANRLGSNSLPSILVEGRSAGKSAAEYAMKAAKPILDAKQVEDGRRDIFEWLERKDGTKIPRELALPLEDIMWSYVGIERNEKDLLYALEQTQRARKDLSNVYLNDHSDRYNMDLIAALELPMRITCGEIITRSALTRTESRGGHFRSDYPNLDNENWLCNVIVQKVNGKMTSRKSPIEEYIMTKAEWDALGYYGV